MYESLIPAVRAIVGDDTEPYLFTDEQITAVLEATEGSVFISSAILIERIATDEALLYRYVRTDDLLVNGVPGAKLLFERAKQLREQGADDVGAAADESFDIVYPAMRTHTRLEYSEVPLWP